MEESLATTQLVRDYRPVEVHGRPGELNLAPEAVTLPEPRPIGGYITAPCKHECIIIRQIRHAKHARRFLKSPKPVKQALMRAAASQYRIESS